MNLLTLLPILALLGCTLAANEEDMKEARCLASTPPALATNLDYSWLASVPLWYFGFASQLDMYRTAADMLDRNVEDILDEEVYDNGCTMVKWVGTTTWFYGFGKRMAFPLQPTEPGVFTFRSPQLKLGATIRTVKTDNRSYIVSHVCWEDDQASWSVLTTKPPAQLDLDVRKEIRAKLKELGFKEQHHMQLRYDTCDVKAVTQDNPPEGGGATGKDEF